MQRSTRSTEPTRTPACPWASQAACTTARPAWSASPTATTCPTWAASPPSPRPPKHGCRRSIPCPARQTQEDKRCQRPARNPQLSKQYSPLLYAPSLFSLYSLHHFSTITKTSPFSYSTGRIHSSTTQQHGNQTTKRAALFSNKAPSVNDLGLSTQKMPCFST